MIPSTWWCDPALTRSSEHGDSGSGEQLARHFGRVEPTLVSSLLDSARMMVSWRGKRLMKVGEERRVDAPSRRETERAGYPGELTRPVMQSGNGKGQAVADGTLAVLSVAPALTPPGHQPHALLVDGDRGFLSILARLVEEEGCALAYRTFLPYEKAITLPTHPLAPGCDRRPEHLTGGAKIARPLDRSSFESPGWGYVQRLFGRADERGRIWVRDAVYGQLPISPAVEPHFPG